jgi:hypothetical protein
VVGATSTSLAETITGGGTLGNDSECQPSKISSLTCRRFLASIHGSNLELLGIGNNDDCGGSGDTGRTEIESASLFSYSSDICATGIVFNEIWTCMVPWSQLIHYSLIAPRVAKGKRPVLYTPKPDSVDEQVLMNLVGSSAAGCLNQSPHGGACVSGSKHSARKSTAH